jgi:hypothetical protein
MAPQPLSLVRTNPTIRILDSGREPNAKLSGMAMGVIRIASLIDLKWSEILVDILHADPKTGMAMYQALISADAKRAALLAAASARMSEQDSLLFRACVASTYTVREVRNKFAHHIWAVCDDIPDALLLASPDALTVARISAAEAVRRQRL